MARVIRSRVLNPKWINGVKRHGYKGAFEIAATVDYMFAFAATTGAVKSHHFDAVEAAFLEDDDTRDFMAEANGPALREIAQRLQEAIDRGLWQPRSNSAKARIARLPDVHSPGRFEYCAWMDFVEDIGVTDASFTPESKAPPLHLSKQPQSAVARMLDAMDGTVDGKGRPRTLQDLNETESAFIKTNHGVNWKLVPVPKLLEKLGVFLSMPQLVKIRRH